LSNWCPNDGQEDAYDEVALIIFGLVHYKLNHPNVPRADGEVFLKFFLAKCGLLSTLSAMKNLRGNYFRNLWMLVRS